MRAIKETIYLPISKLVIGGFDLRSLSEFEDLKTSIEHDGILQPISVRVNKSTPDKYDVIDGHRRVRVATILKLKEIPAVIYNAFEDKDAWKIAIVTNTVRETLTPRDQGKAIKRYRELYPEKSGETVAIELGIAYNTMINYLALADLDPSIKIAQKGERPRTIKKDGTIRVGVAYEIAQATAKRIPEMNLRHAKQREIATTMQGKRYNTQTHILRVFRESSPDVPIETLMKKAEEDVPYTHTVVISPKMNQAFKQFKLDRNLQTSPALRMLLLEALKKLGYMN